MPFSGASSQPRDGTCVSCVSDTAGGSFPPHPLGSPRASLVTAKGAASGDGSVPLPRRDHSCSHVTGQNWTRPRPGLGRFFHVPGEGDCTWMSPEDSHRSPEVQTGPVALNS